MPISSNSDPSSTSFTNEQASLVISTEEDYLRRLEKCLHSLIECSNKIGDGDKNSDSGELDQVEAVESETRNEVFGASCSLQVIANGLHHKDEIYGKLTKLANCQEFLNQLKKEIGVLSTSCFEFTKKYMLSLLALNQETLYQLLEMSTDCIILATGEPHFLPSFAKIFVILWKQFQLRISKDTNVKPVSPVDIVTKLLNHTKLMVENILCNNKTDEDQDHDASTSSDTQLKTVNYIGKLIWKFLSESKIDQNQWSKCLVAALKLAPLVEKENQIREEKMQILSFYPKIMAMFAGTHRFADEVVTISDSWEYKLRIIIKLKIMLECSHAVRIWKILISIFHDITLLSDEKLINHEDLNEFIYYTVLFQLSQFMRMLDEVTIHEIQRNILKYFIYDWPEKHSLTVADLIGHIFRLIVQNVDAEVKEEYLTVLSNSCLPPQIRYFIVPVLLDSLNINPNTQHQNSYASVQYQHDVELVRNYELLNSNSNQKSMRKEDIDKFLCKVWSQLKNCNCDQVMDKLLPICVNSTEFMMNLDGSTASEILAIVPRFLHKPNSLSVLASCTLLLGSQRFTFEKSRLWENVSDICFGIVKACKKASIAKCVAVFAMKCVCSFMDDIKVESEDMIIDLKIKIQNATQFEDSGSGTQNTFKKKVCETEGKSEFYVPMFEKISSKIIESNLELSQNERERLAMAILNLNEFLRKS